jgi:hypothetical protein
VGGTELAGCCAAELVHIFGSVLSCNGISFMWLQSLFIHSSLLAFAIVGDFSARHKCALAEVAFWPANLPL